MRKLMQRRTSDLHVKVIDDDFSLLCLTWNVGNAMPREEELAAWLPNGGGDYDLIVVGTQENAFKEKDKDQSEANMSMKVKQDVDDDEIAEASDVAPTVPGEVAGVSVVNDSGSHGATTSLSSSIKSKVPGVENKTTVWDVMCAERMGKEYGCVKHVVLWEMRLTVYAKTKHLKGPEACITNVASATARTGIAGVLANKGGLVVKFFFGQTSLCFVSCHLAAHAHKNKERNENFREVLRKTSGLGNKLLDVTSEVDHTFWMGDLNYRVDLNDGLDKMGPYPTEEAHLAQVKAMIEGQQWQPLLDHDQLLRSRAAGDSFVGFVEGASDFSPTFKVKRVVGTEHKDQRIPSYCDRVLWNSMPQWKSSVQQVSLASCPAVSTSDHKPVAATFSVTPSVYVQRINRAAYFPVVRLSAVSVSNLRDSDLQGGSDPYLLFFSNPCGLVTEKGCTPASVTKRAAAQKKGSQAVLPPAEAADGPVLERTEWTEREVPLLRPIVKDIDLLNVTLVVAIYDEDFGPDPDDLLGVVRIPLGHPGGLDGMSGAVHHYTLDVDEPVVLYGATKNTGRFKATVNVSFGDATHEALKDALDSGCGADATTLSKKQAGCCSVA